MVGRSACRRRKAITETYRGHVFADAKSAQCIDPMHPIEACHHRLLNVIICREMKISAKACVEL